MVRRVWTGLAGLLLITACGRQAPPSAPPTPPPPPKPAADATQAAPKKAGKWVVGMSQCNLGEPWRKQMNTDLETAAAQHADQLELVFNDAQNDSARQQAQVRDFISRGVDLIIISPKEAKPLAKPVSEAMAKHIPVIVLDRDLDGGDYTCFIGGDNVQIGKAAGQYLVKLLGGKGKVVELKGLETSVPSHDRHNGFMEGIKGSQIEIVFNADCKWLEPEAKKEMQSALTQHQQIDAVYGHNDPSAHGAYLAAKQAGRDKEMKFIGIDALPHEGVQYVKEGILAATFEYPTGGAEAIDTALKILGGGQVAKRITLGTKRFTKDNADKGGEAVK